MRKPGELSGSEAGKKRGTRQGERGVRPEEHSDAAPRSPISDTAQILLVDDDPIFGKIMSRLAEQSRVNLTYCRSLDELGEKAWWKYHAAIVDFDLGTSTGLELIAQLEQVLGEVPIILISVSNQVDVPISRWPGSIKGFIQKSLGHVAILEAAMAAHDLAIGQAHRTA